MTPAARVQAAAEILDHILDGEAAERALTGWARQSRFAGSGDRAAIRDHVFQALRCKRSYARLGGAETGRGLMIGMLRAANADLAAVFTGDGHAPPALSPAESAPGGLPPEGGERLDLPDWLLPLFQAALGDGATAAAVALQTRAPVMLRVNTRLKTRSNVIDLLNEDGIQADLAGIAGTALRVTGGARRVAGSRAYRDGLVELQDGSSQAAMEALAVPAHSRVLDYCAGGGGKVLALAARAEANWFAHDADATRMSDLPGRMRRAGSNVTILPPGEAGSAAPYALILCDVPCSGSGTWRRTPDAKWRLTPERLRDLCRTQAAILSDAARLVASGGVLAYATCSVLREENEAQIDRFLTVETGWTREFVRRWQVSGEGDGFYLAQLRRVPAGCDLQP